MSFSNQLTEMYHLLKNSGDSLEFIYTSDFTNYLQNLNTQEFVNSVFVYGFEIRDETLGTIDSEALKLLEIVSSVYLTHEDALKADDQLMSIYNIGILNIYLYFCERRALVSQPINPELYNYTANSDSAVSPVNNTLSVADIDINRSVNFLRLATKLASDNMHLAKGIYLYHTMRIFDYIYSVFDNYKVDNDNKPIDLDSFYVFSDQADSMELWNELARQIKAKYI